MPSACEAKSSRKRSKERKESEMRSCTVGVRALYLTENSNKISKTSLVDTQIIFPIPLFFFFVIQY